MAWHRCLHKKVLRTREIKKRFPKPYHPIRILHVVWNAFRFVGCLVINAVILLPVWVWEMFKLCPYKKIQTDASFLIIGHRGAAAYEIENTIPAFEKALSVYGANALEMDISFTKDKQVVIWHDWEPDNIISIVRQLGVEPNVKYKPIIPDDERMIKDVHKLTLSELRTWYGYALKKSDKKEDAYIPTLNEVFEWAKEQETLKMIILDIKVPVSEKHLTSDLMSSILKIIQQSKPHFTVLMMSPQPQIIQAMKAAAPDLNYTYDVELPPGIVLDPEAYSSIKKAIKDKNHFASVGRPTVLQLGPWTTYRRLIKFDLAEKKKYEGSDQEIKRLITWTINRRREMKCLISMNVKAMVTDRPDRLKKYIQPEKSN